MMGNPPKPKNIIEIGDFAIAKRYYRLKGGKCEHNRVCLDCETHRVECQDCDEFLDPFWTLVKLTEHWGSIDNNYKHREEKIIKDEKATLHLRAAKRVQELLYDRRHIPTCPHCKEAMFAEDFLNMKWTGKELAKAKRGKKEAAQDKRTK